MQLLTVTIFGGTGFLGSQLRKRFEDDQFVQKVYYTGSRRSSRAEGTKSTFAAWDALRSARIPWLDTSRKTTTSAYVYLIGDIENRSNFLTLHRSAPAKIAQKVSPGCRYIFVSALGASLTSRSRYARTKALGEKAVLEKFPSGAIVLRPSIVFGPGDRFFPRLATLARFLPVVPITGGHVRFQPVHVDDVTTAIQRICRGEAGEPGKTYELGGPTIYSFKDLARVTLLTLGKTKPVMNIPLKLAAILARLPFQRALYPDQVKLLKESDNVVSRQAVLERRTILDLLPPNYTLRTLEDSLPENLGTGRQKKTGKSSE